MSIIITLIILGVIVLIHEWGHFIVARKCNILVEEFAIGMGPKLFGIKKGDTLYSIRMLPLGGFCKMAEEMEEGSKYIGFNDASVYKRIAISLAGPFMNFVLAMIIMVGIVMCIGVSTNKVSGLIDNLPAQRDGIQVGDKIISYEDRKIRNKDELNEYMSNNNGEIVSLGIERSGKKLDIQITPEYDKAEERYLIGVIMYSKAPLIDIGLFGGEEIGVPKVNIIDCVKRGFWNTVDLVRMTVVGVFKMFTMQVSVDQVAGPIGLTSAISGVYTKSMEDGIKFVLFNMFYIVALLSANLGVLNLLPIPALDGGRVVIYIIELIRRKKIPPEKEGIIHIIGFVLLMALGIVIAISDVIKIV